MPGNMLAITENGTTYDLSFDPSQNFVGLHFALSSDGSGGTDVRLIPTATDDFNGNGTSDILLRNSSGSLVDWMMGTANFPAGTRWVRCRAGTWSAPATSAAMAHRTFFCKTAAARWSIG